MANARAIWSGTISFGLVSINVKLFPAVRESRIHFNLLHAKDMSRLRRKLVCETDGEEVKPNEIVRGYEVAPDQYVVIEDKELERVAPEDSRAIDIHDFVDLAEIDPLYYDRPYYVSPDERAAKAYRLLAEAMRRSKKVAIATFVMRGKEYLAALRPIEDAICLETMRFGQEVLTPKQVEAGAGHAAVDERELKMAQQLVDSLSASFDPGRYHDEYQERLKQLVDAKASGEKLVSPPPAEEHRGKVINLMEALQASLAKAGSRRQKTGGRSQETAVKTQEAGSRRRKSA